MCIGELATRGEQMPIHRSRDTRIHIECMHGFAAITGKAVCMRELDIGSTRPGVNAALEPFLLPPPECHPLCERAASSRASNIGYS